MLRRFEIYALGPDATAEAAWRLAEACRHCGRYIPEVLDSAVGTNLSDAPVHLVWEHAYAGPDAYRRYMVHPYHAAVLDKYLLADSPERVVVDDVLGAGLVGYRCDEPAYRMASGVRRVVLLRLGAPGTGAERDAADLRAVLEATAYDHAEVAVSVMAANTFGAAWFDGETPVGPAPRWTHIWEQGFADRTAFEAYRSGPVVTAGAARDAWADWSEGRVRRVAEVFYELHGPDDPASGVTGATDKGHR